MIFKMNREKKSREYKKLLESYEKSYQTMNGRRSEVKQKITKKNKKEPKGNLMPEQVEGFD